MRPPYGTIASLAGSGLLAALGRIVKKETAEAIGGLLGGFLFNLGDTCNQPAPEFPTLTTEDWFNALSPIHTGDYTLSVQRFLTWVTAYMWPTWCACRDGLPAAPSSPTAIPDIDSNPGVPGPSGGGHCSDVTYSLTQPGEGNSPVLHDYTTIWLPQTQTVTVTPQLPDWPKVAQLMPTGVTNFKQAYSVADQPGFVSSAGVSGAFFNSAGTQVGSWGGPGCINCQLPLNPITIPSGAVSWGIAGHNTNTAPYTFVWELQFDCSGAGPTTVEQPCCPPDPILEYKLNQILNVVLNLTGGGSVLPPVSWHDGLTHTALRGAGSFTIDPKAIGIRFNVTTPPAGVQVDPGNPDFYWDMGFWSPYALGSPLRGGRLVYLNQSVALPEFSDQIGYTLKHGTVMNATELLPTTS